MVVCPNCSHQNPDGAIQCEACYTPLPAMLDCPTCGASVQSDASFCGQCGAKLNVVIIQSNSGPESVLAATAGANNAGLSEAAPYVPNSMSTSEPGSTVDRSDMPDMPDIPDLNVPDLAELDPFIEPEPLLSALPDLSTSVSPEMSASIPQAPVEPMNFELSEFASEPVPPDLSEATMPSTDSKSPSSSPLPTFQTTQIQTQAVQLLHTDTNTLLDIPSHLAVVHIGKPNDRVSPDIDVSGFKDSEVVSRVHADIRVEGNSYYLEDVGSSNGTYVNNIPLLPGNRHKLRTGDRIALGKGDKVSFIIQIT